MATTPRTLSDVKRLVASCGILVYAPPAYGKTTYITNRKRQDYVTVFDTDDLRCPPQSDLEILVTNMSDLLVCLSYECAIVFLPSREQFRSGCVFRGLKYQDLWYDDVLNNLERASATKQIIVITSGAPILFYDRFITKCFDAVYDGDEFPKVPSPPKIPVVQPTTTRLVVDDIESLDCGAAPKVIVEPIQPGSQIAFQNYASSAVIEQPLECVEYLVLDQVVTPQQVQLAESLALKEQCSIMTPAVHNDATNIIMDAKRILSSRTERDEFDDSLQCFGKIVDLCVLTGSSVRYGPIGLLNALLSLNEPTPAWFRSPVKRLLTTGAAVYVHRNLVHYRDSVRSFTVSRYLIDRWIR